jgi:hypothetical protein
MPYRFYIALIIFTEFQNRHFPYFQDLFVRKRVIIPTEVKKKQFTAIIRPIAIISVYLGIFNSISIVKTQSIEIFIKYLFSLNLYHNFLENNVRARKNNKYDIAVDMAAPFVPNEGINK